MEEKRQYIAIDLKSFYASVECMNRGLNPMTTNLVVADESKTEKTICLAVSPSLKTHGIPGRPRLFEVVEKVKEANYQRLKKAPGKRFSGSSHDHEALMRDPSLAVSYLVAPPRMAEYMEISTRIYGVYLKYIAPEDIHVYSIDEVFIDATPYLSTYRCTAHQLALRMIRDVLKTTGITATAGIGTNLYLAKIAMDILAKKMPADADGVRIAELDEQSYRKQLWEHRPLTSFWRVGKGIASKLESRGIYTMGDIALWSLKDEELFYKLFGINAELLIDHAWGYEPCLISHIKSYKPMHHSISSGQVLSGPYPVDKLRTVVREMADMMAMDLTREGLVTRQIVLDIGYDVESLTQKNVDYRGEVSIDRYGRRIPKHAHGTANLDRYTASARLITKATLELFERIIDPRLLSRRLTITACDTVSEEEASKAPKKAQQLNLFTDYTAEMEEEADERERLEKEKIRQKTILELQKQFGKNAVLKGMNFEEGATARERNTQIGGHKA